MSGLIQFAGWTLVFLTLLDVYLTVLYARGGAGVFTPILNRTGWRAFRLLAQGTGRLGQRLLSFAGPTLITLTVVLWAVLLTVGFALVVWPVLGSSIQASQGQTPTDFTTALYYSGYSLSTVGLGDIVPKTPFYRLLLVMQGAAGFSVLTLGLAYFMSVYSALVSRNAFALFLRHASGSADAADLLARLSSAGEFRSSAMTELSTIGRGVIGLIQTHHAYAALHYFRFPGPEYAMARVTLQTLDAVTLARSALDPDRHGAFAGSTGAQATWEGGLRLLEQTAREFLPGRGGGREDPGEAREAAWRARYRQALERLAQAGVTAHPQPEAGTAAYVEMRRQWEGPVRKLAHHMAYKWSEIAPHEPCLES